VEESGSLEGHLNEGAEVNGPVMVIVKGYDDAVEGKYRERWKELIPVTVPKRQSIKQLLYAPSIWDIRRSSKRVALPVMVYSNFFS